MLGSGAHVKIGTVEYLLDESAEGHYAHNYDHRAAYTANIVGSEGKLSLKENKILWTWDDWSGGEGNAVYYGDEPTRYNYSGAVNVRNRGQLMSRPTRIFKELATADLGVRPLMATGIGRLWVTTAPVADGFGNYDYKFYYTSDGTNWTAVQPGTNANSVDDFVSAIAGDNDKVYWSAWNTNTGGRQLGRVNSDDTITTIAVTVASPHLGLAPFDGALYAWDGVTLDKISITGFTTIESVSPAILNAPDGDNIWSTYWGDLIVADNQLYMFVTVEGFSKVFEYHLDRGFGEFWTAPVGFSIKAFAYQNGKLYCAGGWGGSASNTTMHGYGAVYEIDLDTRQAAFTTFTRKQINDQQQLTSIAGSYGNQLIIGAGRHDGQVFIYDADLGAVSILDDLTLSATDAMVWSSSQWQVSDVITFGNKRWASTYRYGNSASGNYQIFSWKNDEPANRQAATADGNPDGVLYTGDSDLGFPYEGKLFHGVHVTYAVETPGNTSGLANNQQIVVKGSFDDGTAVTLATITSATTPSTGIQGRHFVSYLANNQKFYKMSLEIYTQTDGSTSVGDKTPIIQAVTVEASLDDYEEVWDLTLRIKDELPQDAPTDRKLIASDLRDNILDAVEAKNSVTFLDGYRYPERGDYTTHTVTIENPQDSIGRNAEGSMRVRLRAVTK